MSNYPPGAESAIDRRARDDEAYDRWLSDHDYPEARDELAGRLADMITEELEGPLDSTDRIRHVAVIGLTGRIDDWLNAFTIQNAILAAHELIPQFDPEQEQRDAESTHADDVLAERKDTQR